MQIPIQPDLEAQVKISKMLSRGFAFSIVWMGGIGSLLAFITGFRARKLIRQSDGVLSGMGMAWWCIIVGAFGMVILPLMIVIKLISAQK